MTRSSRDLVEESHVGVVENPYVRDVVAEHGDAGRAHSECPASVALTIQPCRIDHRRMHHPRAEYLHPAGPLAARAAGSVTDLALHIHLGRRFGEWEITRPEARFGFAEESVGEMRQSRLEIDEADSFVDCQSFDL